MITTDLCLVYNLLVLYKPNNAGDT